MEFYDVREGAFILSSHKSLHGACMVQQQDPTGRCVVLTRLDGTKWRDLREYSTAECRKVIQDTRAKGSRR